MSNVFDQQLSLSILKMTEAYRNLFQAYIEFMQLWYNKYWSEFQGMAPNVMDVMKKFNKPFYS